MKKNDFIKLDLLFRKTFLKKGEACQNNLLIDRAFLILVKDLKKNPMFILEKAVFNIMPFFVLKNKKIGKRSIVIPFFLLSEVKRKIVGIRWIIEAAVKRSGNLSNNLALEISDAFYNRGSVKKKQKEFHLTFLKNRANMKFRWK